MRVLYIYGNQRERLFAIGPQLFRTRGSGSLLMLQEGTRSKYLGTFFAPDGADERSKRRLFRADDGDISTLSSSVSSASSSCHYTAMVPRLHTRCIHVDIRCTCGKVLGFGACHVFARRD